MDYSASKESRFRRRRNGVPLTGGGADYHYRNDGDFLRMMEYSLDMDRNDMLVGQMIDRAVTNEIQDGFRLDPNTPDEDLNLYLAEKWRTFAEEPENCDLQGENCFSDMEFLVSRACKVDGDIVAIPTHIDNGGQIRLIEGHRVRTPNNARRSAKHQNVIHGVRLENGTRKRTEYWITKEDVDPTKAINRIGDFTRYHTRDEKNRRQVCHVHQCKRVSQTRGVTALAPIFDLVGMVDDINFAKLVQQQVVACFAIIHKKAIGSGGIGNGSGDDRGETSSQTLKDGSARTLVGVSPGMEIFGEEGEDITGFSPNVASTEFVEHMRMMITFIAANLGMPPGVAMLDPNQTNLSSWRGALDEARRGFRMNQRRLINRFHIPIYKIKIRQWIMEDEVVRAGFKLHGPDLFKHTWHPPRWPYIEPLKDAKTEEVLLAGNLASRTTIAKGRGLDVESQDKEIVRDNGNLIVMAKTRAKEINDEFPDDPAPITWQNVLNPQSTASTVDVIDTADPDYQTAQSDNTKRKAANVY
jgi:lambda family phage portal protein